VRKAGIEALKEAKSSTRLCHLHTDDIEDFVYQDDYEDDQISSWEELEARAKANSDDDDED
jgi:hypothetical protein